MRLLGSNRDRRTRAGLDTLADRVQALGRLADLMAPHVPARRLAGARALVGRAGERLALSRSHTVVALAGATGGGKSSIFNALAGRELSAVGVRRPTTGETHACVWGDVPDAAPARVSAHETAGELLDWLEVPRRYSRDDEPALSGLVLLDLPDFDSVEATHRIEADRLVALADLIVWVVDPQKYADRVLHRRYLREYGRHRDITVLVLNQADRLDDAELLACLTDLHRLLVDDGLDGVPALACSTVGRPGLDELRAALERTVAARIAALQRLSADAEAIVADLERLVPGPVAPVDDRAVAQELFGALSVAAGVPEVARATERAYVHRAVAHTGWPVTRWVRRARPDPLRRLGLRRFATGRPAVPGFAGGPAEVVSATSIGPAGPAASARVALAVRAVGEHHGAGLPEPWPAAMLAAARSHVAELTDALDVAVSRTDLGLSRQPRWWRVVGGLQWLFALTAGLGLLWLATRYVLFALALPEPPSPDVGRVPLFTLLLGGGLLAGLGLAALCRPIVAQLGRRHGRRAVRALAASVDRVGDELVLRPVARVDQELTDARQALAVAKVR